MLGVWGHLLPVLSKSSQTLMADVDNILISYIFHPYDKVHRRLKYDFREIYTRYVLPFEIKPTQISALGNWKKLRKSSGYLTGINIFANIMQIKIALSIYRKLHHLQKMT